jgi:rRNA maturation RNase YbeY
MEISIRNRQRSIETDRAGIEKSLEAALSHLASGRLVKGRNLASGLSFDPLSASLGVTLVGDKEMRAMNLAYRGKDRTTDVLSFSQLEGLAFDSQTAELGDIIISPAQAKRQAEERGHSLKQEMRILLIHGLLHLIGYDHEKSSYQAARMRKMEEELMGAIKKVGR